MGALDEELTKRPVLEGVLVLKSLDFQPFEALVSIDASTKTVNYRVHYFR